MAQSIRPGAPRPAAGWILGSSRDLLLFIATPLLILPLVAGVQRRLSVEEIALYVAAFGALGHHLPGMMRAYGDRELFARFRLRFVLAPIFFVAVSLFFAFRDLNALVVITLVWGIWHGLAQVYGFCRIYDAKVGHGDRATALIDQWVCIAWFGAAVLHSPGRMAAIFEEFYLAGGPLISAGGFHAFRAVWSAATGAVTLAFVGNLLWQLWHGRSPSSAKLLLIASSFAFWWYACVGVSDAILGIALFEVFHDVQYLAITWIYNRRIVDKGHRVGAFTRLLFRNSRWMAGLYVLLVFAYGATSLFSRSLDQGSVRLTLLAFVSASTFLHFYYDGFIWKVRERATRDGLDVRGGEAAAPRARFAPRLAQGARWALFAVPVLWLGAAELGGGRANDPERYAAIVAAVPASRDARINLANSLGESGDLAGAAAAYRDLLRLHPDDAPAHTLLAEVYGKQGRHRAAVESYRQALSLAPGSARIYNSLGLAHQSLGDLASARHAFETAVALDPDAAKPHSNLGALLQARGEPEPAAEHYRRAIALDPALPDPHNNLGVLLEERGDLSAAARHLETALRLRENPTTRANLLRVRAALGN